MIKETRKIVITGMGAVTPVGCSTGSLWRSVVAGQCGIDRIKGFEDKKLPVSVAGQVKEFNPGMHGMTKVEIRHYDLFSQYACAAAAEAISDALIEAGYSPEDSLYINAHGTGTVLNDKAETNAIKLALGDTEARKASISSTKSMTGHMMGAAGAVECIIAALSLRKGIIPPTINLLHQDPECDLDYTPLKAVKRDITIAISNSMGFGGHNACLALRRYNNE